MSLKNGIESPTPGHKRRCGTGRSRYGGMAVNIVLVAMLLMPVEAIGQAAPLPMPSARLKAVAERLAALVVGENTAEGLVFGWADRPETRITLALAIKTARVLEREATMRARGVGAIPDATLERMLTWLEGAVDGVYHGDTLREEAGRPWSSDAGGPRYSFVDESTSTRDSELFGDLDLMAAMGQRGYARVSGDLLLRLDAEGVMPRRASAVGLEAVLVPPAAMMPGSDPSAIANVDAGAYRRLPAARTLAEMIGGATRVASGLPLVVADPPQGESWGASLARRGLARALSDGRFTVIGWRAPRHPSVAGAPPLVDSIAAAMWLHAATGQQEAYVFGWRDLRDGSVSPWPSLLTEPEQLHAIAQAANEIVRAGGGESWRLEADLTVLVDAGAVSGRNPNTWAPWCEPFWSAMLARQVVFDVLPRNQASLIPDDAVRVVLDRATAAGGTDSFIVGVERALAGSANQDRRVTAHKADGSPAENVLAMRLAAPPGGILLVNFSAEAGSVRLSGALPSGRTVDRLRADESISIQREIPLTGWQVRWLSPSRE